MDTQSRALQSIREFLQSKTSYDVLPVSFKIVMLDTKLTLKGTLLTLLQNGIISAPLWDSNQSRFAGLLSSQDFMNVAQYLIDRPEKAEEINTITLDQLAEIESTIGARQIETSRIHPFKSLYETCQHIVESKAHRVPLIDTDPETGREIVVSVLTQYRVLRFVALNCKETQDLNIPIKDLNLATRENLHTATMDTQLADVVGAFSKYGVSCVPIVDENNKLLNVYEAYDVMTLIKGNGFSDFSLSIGKALMRRPQDFEGVITCSEHDSVAHIMETIRRSRVLRLCMVDEEGKLLGLVTLVDILNYIMFG